MKSLSRCGIFQFVAILCALIASLSTFSVVPASASRETKAPLTVAYDETSGTDYVLFTLPTCEVGDGLTILRNSGKHPIVVSAVNVMVPTQPASSLASTAYLLESFIPGATHGAAGATFKIALAGGTSMGNAIGATIQPFKTRPLWYVIVVHMQATEPHGESWAIRGLRVTYKVGHKTFHVVFSQTIGLPRTSC